MSGQRTSGCTLNDLSDFLWPRCADHLLPDWSPKGICRHSLFKTQTNHSISRTQHPFFRNELRSLNEAFHHSLNDVLSLARPFWHYITFGWQSRWRSNSFGTFPSPCLHVDVWFFCWLSTKPNVIHCNHYSISQSRNLQFTMPTRLWRMPLSFNFFSPSDGPFNSFWDKLHFPGSWCWACHGIISFLNEISHFDIWPRT